MYKKILVPFDFSKIGEKALKEALEVSKKLNSKIILLNVIGEKIDTSGMNLTRAQQVHEEAEKKIMDKLNEIKNSAQKRNVNISLKIVHNPSVVDGILIFSKNNLINLIIMGSHGKSGFKKLVLGSAASGVVTKAKCPVMIVK